MTSATASSSNQQVVQAIFDSLTRCLNPIDEEDGPFSSRCPRQSPEPVEPPTAATPKARGGASTAGRDERKKKSAARSTSGSGSSSNDNDGRQDSGDSKNADRYLHRKLEIFRTTDEEVLAELGYDRRAASAKEAARSSSRTRGGHHQRDNRSAKANNTLVYSSSDEIDNLTRSHKRDEGAARRGLGIGKCGADYPAADVHPVEAFVRLLRDPFSCVRDVQNVVQPLGLCFATPVRSASRDENIANLSDWKLTAEEFAARQERLTVGCGGGGANERRGGAAGAAAPRVDPDVPDADESSASHCDETTAEEEETITSASYFDQKYSHIVETNPPVPLYGRDRIKVSEFETGGLFELVKRRGAIVVGGEKDKPSGGASSSGRGKSPRPGSIRRPGPRGPAGGPPGGIVVKKGGSRAQSRGSRASGGSGKKRSSKRDHRQYEALPAGRSSSVSDTPSNEAEERGRCASYRRSPRGRRTLREPDIVYATAAGI